MHVTLKYLVDMYFEYENWKAFFLMHRLDNLSAFLESNKHLKKNC